MATYNKSGTPQLQTSLLATIIYICLKHIEFVIVKFNKNSNTTQLMPAIYGDQRFTAFFMKYKMYNI